MPSLAAGGDERSEDARAGDRIVGSLGMPLDADHVSAIRGLDGLDHAVRRGRHDVESAGIIQCLHVMTVDHAFEPSASHGMARAVSMLVRRVEVVGEVLVEMAARMKTHHLHPEAYPEDREIRRRVLEEVEQFEFEGLTIRCDEGGRRMNGLIEGAGVGIVAAAQNHSVEMRENLRSGSRAREERDRDASRIRHASGVTASEADLVLDEIGRDTNERATRGNR